MKFYFLLLTMCMSTHIVSGMESEDIFPKETMPSTTADIVVDIAKTRDKLLHDVRIYRQAYRKRIDNLKDSHDLARVEQVCADENYDLLLALPCEDLNTVFKDEVGHAQTTLLCSALVKSKEKVALSLLDRGAAETADVQCYDRRRDVTQGVECYDALSIALLNPNISVDMVNRLLFLSKSPPTFENAYQMIVPEVNFMGVSGPITLCGLLEYDITPEKRRALLNFLRRHGRYTFLKQSLYSMGGPKNGIKYLLAAGEFSGFELLLEACKQVKYKRLDPVVAEQTKQDIELYRQGCQELNGLFNQPFLGKLLLACAGTDIFLRIETSHQRCLESSGDSDW